MNTSTQLLNKELEIAISKLKAAKMAYIRSIIIMGLVSAGAGVLTANLLFKNLA